MADPIANEVDLVTLYEIYPKVIEDLFFMDTAMLAAFRAKCLVPFHGGAFMQNVFSYAPMVVGSYAKGQNWNLNKRQTLGGTRFDPKYYVAVIPEYEEDIEVTNKGELAVFKLIDTDLRNGMNSISAASAVALAQHGQATGTGIIGNRPNDMNGWIEAHNDGILPGWDGSIFTSYGTAARNAVIGSALNSSPYWCGDSAGNTGLITYAKMNTTYMQCSRGKQQPDRGFGNKAVIGFIEERIQPQQRFAQEQDPYWGVAGLKMKNAIILHDDYFPSVMFGVNDPDLGNYLVPAITYTAPGTVPTGSNFPTVSCTLAAGEVFLWMNTDKWLFRISDSRKYGYGASGFVPAQANSRVVCVIRAAVNAECVAPWSGKQLLGIGG